MQMAADATSGKDAESRGCHRAQLGHLGLEVGQMAGGRRGYSQADHVCPGHPFAVAGLGHVAAAEGDFPRALAILNGVLTSAPTPADLAFAGDLLGRMGQQDEAERHYRLAEAAWRTDMPEPSRLARFLAEHGRKLDEAIVLADRARADRNDIFTADALAWASFQTAASTGRRPP